MFGDLLGNMEEKQAAMKKKLAEIIVKEEVGDKAVVIEANANREIINIKIDKTKLNSGDSEELEDLLLIAINRVLAQAAEREAIESQKLINDMLPPGMGGLFGG